MQKTIRQWKEELVGKKFNRLTVLDVVQGFTKSGIKDGFRASCLCSCGNHVVVRIYALLNNNTMSCGCLALETQKKTGTKNFDEWKKKHPDILLENMAKAREKAKVWGKSHPDKIREKYQKMLECSKKWRDEHPEEAKNNSKKAISIAHEWNKNHPEEMKIISEKGLHAIKKWRDENNLLNNDYGFDIDGEQIEPKSFWISTCNPKRKVDNTYMKGKVLIFNSGYTLCTCI